MFKKDYNYTPEEYLALEETEEYKSEYYNGEIFAMAGGSANHNRIGLNVASMFNTAFEKRPCETFMSDMRLLVEKVNLYTYPDVLAVCGDIEFVPGRTDTITNHILVVEVLSESTENYDRGKKFEFYRSIPSLQHYILIDQDRVHVEHFEKRGQEGWVLREFNAMDKVIRLDLPNLEISISRIYSRVKWDDADSA